MTAVGNDDGSEEAFARQVQAHGRPGDVLLVPSTSAAGGNLVAVVETATTVGMGAWALTGPVPNPLTAPCDEHVAVTGPAPTAQECHLVAVHLLRGAVDTRLAAAGRLQEAGDGPPSTTIGEGRRLVVVGDLLVDESVCGRVERVCPHVPVPVPQSPGRVLGPGGAGLAALLAAQDGHDVTLITAHADDDAASVVIAQLSAVGVRVVNLGTGTATAITTRFRADGQTLLMVDHAQPPGDIGPLNDHARTVLEQADGILVTDHGRGMAAAQDIRQALSALTGRVPVVWDPHPRDPAPVPGVTVVTPNAREAAGFCPQNTTPSLPGDVQRARTLLATWNVGQVVVTRGRHGAVLVTAPNTPPLVVPAPGAVAQDARGAGHRLAVALVAALAAGMTPSSALAAVVTAATAYAAATTCSTRGL